jgi:hypothetical protein
MEDRAYMECPECHGKYRSLPNYGMGVNCGYCGACLKPAHRLVLFGDMLLCLAALVASLALPHGFVVTFVIVEVVAADRLLTWVAVKRAMVLDAEEAASRGFVMSGIALATVIGVSFALVVAFAWR